VRKQEPLSRTKAASWKRISWGAEGKENWWWQHVQGTKNKSTRKASGVKRKRNRQQNSICRRKQEKNVTSRDALGKKYSHVKRR